jgi:hypothetical protein
MDFIFLSLFYFLVLLGIELRVSHLQGECFTNSATPLSSFLFLKFVFSDKVFNFCPDQFQIKIALSLPPKIGVHYHTGPSFRGLSL